MDRLGGGEAQGLVAAQGGGGQASFTSSAAVVRDAERAALVIVKATSCRGRHGSKSQRGEHQASTRVMRVSSLHAADLRCVTSNSHRVTLFRFILFTALTITLQPLSDQSKQHLSTVVAEGRGSVRVHVEGVGSNLKIFKGGCR